MNRIKSTLTTIDSNMRIDSDERKYFKAEIAVHLNKIACDIENSTELMAQYIESPFVTSVGWQGNLNLKKDLQAVLENIKSDINDFGAIIAASINQSNSVSDKSRQSVAISGHDDAPREIFVPIFLDAMPDHIEEERVKYSAVHSTKHRLRLGNTMDTWHKIYPMRAFCTLVVQNAIQVTTNLFEFVTFIESNSDTLLIHSSEFGGYFVENKVKQPIKIHVDFNYVSLKQSSGTDTHNPLHQEDIISLV